MYDRILLPTDGSETAERAASYARTVAGAFDATVHVVNVVDVRRYSMVGSELGDIGASTKQQFEDAGKEAIATVEAEISDVPVVTDLLRGVPYAEILDYVDEHDVDLVVMGTHGRTGLDRLLVGSTTERVMRLSDAPVLTVGPDAEPTGAFSRVLVPTDGSDAVEPAVERALELADAFGAAVHVLSVVDVRAFVSDEEGGGMPTVAIETLESQAEEATAAVAEQAEARGLDVVTEVVQGVPARSIVDYADENGIDLVVMGTHGRTGLDRLLLGSVTERVVRRADAPVLTVRRARDEG